MLCPEISNFPSPKVMSFSKKFANVGKVSEVYKMNSFYRSVIITCPDELNTPSIIEECVLEDSDYYKITDCSLAEFLEPVFVEKFVKNGKVVCLSDVKNCFVQNCAAITTDGVLTLHILEYIYQTIGLEGTKRPHGFYEITIDLKNLTKREKLKNCLKKLENFDFYLVWEPKDEDVCPSSIAKYFYDRDIQISAHSVKTQKVTPIITEIPSVKDVDLDEMVEWIGMLAHGADLHPKEMYVSTYGHPESEFALKSTRISLLVVKGFLTSTFINNICTRLNEYVLSRDLENLWAAISVQSNDNSLWQWNISSPKMFQAHDSSCTTFFTKENQLMYSIGQLKYS